MGDYFTRRVETPKTVEASDEETAVLKEEYARASAAYDTVRNAPQDETHEQRIDRYRAKLRVWQDRESARSVRDSKWTYEYHGNVWYYERLASANTVELSC